MPIFSARASSTGGRSRSLTDSDLDPVVELDGLALLLLLPGERRRLARALARDLQRELLPDVRVAHLEGHRLRRDLGRLRWIASLRLLAGTRPRQLLQLRLDQVALSRRALHVDPGRDRAPKVFDHPVHLFLAGFGRRRRQLEGLEVFQVELGPHFDLRREDQRLTWLGDHVFDGRRRQWVELQLRFSLAPVARQQPLDHLLLDLLAESLAHELHRDLALAESRELRLLCETRPRCGTSRRRRWPRAPRPSAASHRDRSPRPKVRRSWMGSFWKSLRPEWALELAGWCERGDSNPHPEYGTRS